MLDAKPRIAAVDYGTKRVGLALADPLQMFAQPHGTFDQREAVEELKQIRSRDGLSTVVIGWPLTEAGEEGPATERVAQYANRLRNALPGVQIVRWDERFTSELAKEKLKEAGAGYGRDKGQVDAAAAAIILQEYLNSAGAG